MKARLSFDTLAYANRLKAAGLESKIAETQAEANAEMLASLMEGVLVSKQELIGFATKQDLSFLATKEDLIHLDAKMELKFEQVDSHLKDLDSKFDSRLTLFGTQIIVRLGGIVISVLVGLTAFLSYFHLIH